MAGKIALFLVVVILVGAVSYAAGWYRRQDISREFEIISVVRELPKGSVNTRGIEPPFTVVGRGYKSEIHILPGILGLKGEAVTIHQ
jgi:hypothetical protein